MRRWPNDPGADGIDVLVDLSGHTGGSRLTASLLIAPRWMVRLAGLLATTGLLTMDAVALFDTWHAPDTGRQFVEPILRLPVVSVTSRCGHLRGIARFRAQWFHHLRLFQQHREVQRWRRVRCVGSGAASGTDARLILKMAHLQRRRLRRQVTDDSFVARGVSAERIELRGPSFPCRPAKANTPISTLRARPFPFTGG